MKADAKKQLKDINIKSIKEIIKQVEPTYYKKIVVADDTDVKRTNYIYMRYEGKELDRIDKKLEFPYYGAIIEDFQAFETMKTQRRKVAIANKNLKIFQTLKETYKIPPQDIDLSEETNWEIFPLKTDEEGLLLEEQDKYFFPHLTSQITGTAEFINGPVEGTFGKLVYVDTVVERKILEKLWLKDGEALEEEMEEEVWNHCKREEELALAYADFSKYESKSKKERVLYDEFSESLCESARNEIGISKMTEEQIYYQVIPCVRLQYKHVLTNTDHELTIINFYDEKKVQIVFHSAPEEVKNYLGNTAKKVTGFFSKMMKTKSYHSKQDRRNEINLMIRLARIDGIIQDAEKIQLSEIIGGLKEFTHTEKQKFYDLMSADHIPELKEEDLVFSDEEAKARVLENLASLAKADKKVVDKEKQLIERIKKAFSKTEALKS